MSIVVGGKVSRLHAPEQFPYRASMDLTPEDIAEFQTIWEEEFGETISERLST